MVLAGFAALRLPQEGMHGAELLCELSVRRIQLGHLQALSRPADLAAAMDAVATLHLHQTTKACCLSTQKAAAWVVSFCAAAVGAICKQLGSSHARLCLSGGEGGRISLSKWSVPMLGGQDITHSTTSGQIPGHGEQLLGTEGHDGRSFVSDLNSVARNIDEAQELAELCVHSASIVKSALVCGVKPIATLGLAVRPIIEALRQKDEFMQGCSPELSSLLQSDEIAGQKEEIKAATHEAVMQLLSVECAIFSANESRAGCIASKE